MLNVQTQLNSMVRLLTGLHRMENIKSVFIVMILSFMVVACQTPKKKLGEGAKTSAPLGYYTLCRNEPENKLCKKK